MTDRIVLPSSAIIALADMFGLLVDAITADWRCTKFIGMSHEEAPPWGTRQQVEDAMIDLARHRHDLGLRGSIHPELHETQHLLGFWTM